MSADGTPMLRVVEGRPWAEALISATSPGAPHRPWHGVEAVKRGDAVVVVIATDPPTVLCGFRHGPTPVPAAIAAACRSGASLRTVEDVQRAAGGHRLTDGLPRDSAAATALLETAREYTVSEPRDRTGESSVAAARILLQSEGRCTCCGGTVEVTAATLKSALHMVSDSDFRDGRDWPALLCPDCTEAMARGGYSSVVDYAHSLRPACPACGAQRTREVSYGMPTYDWHVNMPIWVSGGGCVVGSSGRWVCGECGHSWGSVNTFDDPLLHNAARKLFAQWTGVTNPELLAALWNNLNSGDRRFWIQRAADLGDD